MSDKLPQLTLTAPQAVFLYGLTTPFRCFCGGYGSGKTFVAAYWALEFMAINPGYVLAYYAPTYGMIRDIFFKTIKEPAVYFGFTIKINLSNKHVFVYRGGALYGVIICQTMHDPDNIIGSEYAASIVDEIDTMPTKKADRAWDKILGRMRAKVYITNGDPYDGSVAPGGPVWEKFEGWIGRPLDKPKDTRGRKWQDNPVTVVTTPEGFKFVYHRFKKNPKPSYSMVQGSSLENAKNLPDGYIDRLKETYSDKLVDAYVGGEFVNLQSGAVYYSFDRQKCDTKEQIKPGEPIHIGMDFNVGKMAAAVFVWRGKELHAVDELTGLYDTPEMIGEILARYNGRKIHVYPDASGGSRKSVGASVTDLSLLSNAGFFVNADESNPRVKATILSANTAFSKGRLFISSDRCPTVVENLEQQPYDEKGEPDKTGGWDHSNDAVRYVVHRLLPVVKPVWSLDARW